METITSVRLRQLRKEQYKTAREFAEATGIPYGQVAKWESGERMPTINRLIELAEFFGVDVDYLLGLASTKRKAFDNVQLVTGLSEESIDTLSSSVDKAIVGDGKARTFNDSTIKLCMVEYVMQKLESPKVTYYLVYKDWRKKMEEKYGARRMAACDKVCAKYHDEYSMHGATNDLIKVLEDIQGIGFDGLPAKEEKIAKELDKLGFDKHDIDRVITWESKEARKALNEVFAEVNFSVAEFADFFVETGCMEKVQLLQQIKEQRLQTHYWGVEEDNEENENA